MPSALVLDASGGFMRLRFAILPFLGLLAHSRSTPPSDRASIVVTPVSGTASPVSPYETGHTLVFNVNNLGPGAVNLNFEPPRVYRRLGDLSVAGSA